MTPYPTAIPGTQRGKTYGTAGLLFLFSFLFFLVFRIPVPLNVDTYLYARAIQTFEGPVVHLGYYAIGALCHQVLKPLGVTPLQTLGYISQFFGGISVAGMYVFTFLLTGNRLHALLSALILMFSGAVWLYSIHGEVYVPQLAFVLLSLICILEIRPLLSSMFTFVAISITPTSLLALVPACYLMWVRRYTRTDGIMFGVPILIAAAALLLWNGDRVIGIFRKAVYSPKVFFDEFSYLGLVINIVYRLAAAYGSAFNFVSFLAIAGFVALYRRDKKLWGLILSFILPFLAYFLNLGLISPDHLIISFIAACFLGAFGLLTLLDRTIRHLANRSVVTLLLMLPFAWGSFELFIYRQKTYSNELQRVIHELSMRPWDHSIMLADYNFGVSFWTLTREEKSRDLLEGRPYRLVETNSVTSQKAWDRLRGPFWVSFGGLIAFTSIPELRSLIMGRPVYLVERIDWPIGIVEVFKRWLVRIGLEKEKENLERVRRIPEYLAYKLDAGFVLERMIDSPLHPVYLLRFGVRESSRDLIG